MGATFFQADERPPTMTLVRLVCIAMAGNQYALWDRDGLTFPHGELREGEAPAQAAKRIVQEWTSTSSPKLELVDLLVEGPTLTLVFRALLTEEPAGVAKRAGRMELPERVGLLSGKYVEDALKTSLNYKLTRG